MTAKTIRINLFVLLILCIFVSLKLTTTALKLSDTNIYFLTGVEILKGKVLYRDIFFTNFPLFAYIASFYTFLFQKNPSLFFFSSSIEAACVALILFYIVYKKTKSLLIGITTLCLYLFSFLVLSTSDHQTGVFSASLFAVLSYLFFDKKSFFLCGIFLACTILTKAYFLPLLVTIGIVLLFQKKWKELLTVIVAGILTAFIVLLPSFLFATNDIINDVFKYSLTRSAGLSKTEILWFFINHDFLFFLLLLWNIGTFKKNLFFGIFSILSILFFFLYQDIYYLYLNFMIPILALSFPSFITTLTARFQLQKMVIPTMVVIFICYNLFSYISHYSKIGLIPEYQKLVDVIRNHHPKVLYGINDITPLLSFETNINLLDDRIDTNENIYRKGLLDTKEVTQKAIQQKAIIIGHGAYYPQVGINQPLLDGIFDTHQIEKSCKLIESLPVIAEGITNRINLFRCY